MKPLNKAIRSAKFQKEDWRRVLYRFLLAYRKTPYATTGEAPAELLSIVCSQWNTVSKRKFCISSIRKKETRKSRRGRNNKKKR
jgi:hypothetical protein